jgi:TRAP transporter TAXI family solute receptor
MRIPESIKTYGVIAILVAASFWFAAQFIAPPPPDKIIMAAGSKSGNYYKYAKLYKEALLKQRVHIEILETAGAVENIALLKEGKADIAIIQSGLATDENQENIEALASLYFEPMWIFIDEDDSEDISTLRDFLGENIAIGNQGSGTNNMARQILDANEITPKNTNFVEIGGRTAADKLINGDVKASFFVSGYNSDLIQKLLHNQKLSPFSFRRAESYSRLFPYFSAITLSEGLASLEKNIPSSDLQLLSPTAILAANKNFHGALKTLMVSEIMEIHNVNGAFSKIGDFPTLDYIDFPAAKEAEHYFEYGPNILQRFLPFWLADLVNRLKIMLIPLLGVMIPLFKIAPPTYKWRIRSKIYRWYKKLKHMENEISEGQANLKSILKSLDEIDEEAKNTPVPLSYSDELYNLRMHIRMVKQRLQNK